MGITLLESYELAVFYGIVMMMFGVLLKIWVLLLLYPQYYFWVSYNRIKMRFEVVMIAHSGPQSGLLRWFM